MQGVSPEAPPSVLGWIYLLIAVIFWGAEPPFLLSCCSGVKDTVGEAGDERRRVTKGREKKKE